MAVVKDELDAPLARREALRRLFEKASKPPRPLPGVPTMAVGASAPRTRPSRRAAPPLTLLDEVGRLPAGLPKARRKAWSDRLHTGSASATERARLQVWLGEYDMAVRHQPALASERFALASRLAPAASPEHGLARYDLAVAAFYEGAYRAATTRFGQLLDSMEGGFNRKVAAMFARHASSCAAFHDERAALGVAEPTKLDPLCGVSAVAVCLRALGMPHDASSVGRRIRHDGEGSNMRDLLVGARRLGLYGHAFTASDAALRSLPMPVVAHVERDHFIAVTRADAAGVRYVCSDCGRWPGGEQFVTWRQWRSLVPDAFLSIARKGSAAALALDILGGRKPTLYALAGAAGSVAAASTLAARIPKGALVPQFRGLTFYDCVVKPSAQHCDPFRCCPMAVAGAGDDASPLSGDPVNLATGEEEYRPAPDLVVYNPKGPNVSWGRLYNSLSNGGHGSINEYSSNYGFGLGWSHGYNVGVRSSVDSGDLGEVLPDDEPMAYVDDASAAPVEYPQVSGTVVFENESTIPFNGKLADAAHPTTNMTVPNGVPLLVQCVYNPATQGYFITATFRDRTRWECEEQTDGEYRSNFHRLHRLYDRIGNFISFHYGTYTVYDGDDDDTRITMLDRIDDSAGQSLLTLGVNTRTSEYGSASDRYGRSVYYAAVISPDTMLQDVSQIVPTGTANPPIRYQYGYMQIANPEALGIPFLKTIAVPSATGSGVATGTFNYTSQGYVDNIVDGNGNKTVFTQTPGNTTKVSKTDGSGNVFQTWTESFDNSMSATGSINASGQSMVTKTYGDPNDPFSASSVLVNISGGPRTWTFSYDRLGNLLSKTSPKGTKTSYGYDYTQFALGERTSMQEGTKTPTSYTYFEPSGLVQEVDSPTPGASGTSATQATTYSYTPLGNTASVTVPGSGSASSRMFSFGYTTDGAYTQTEAISEPLTMTDALGKVWHWRYDARGNALSVTDPMGHEKDAVYNVADGVTTTLLPATGNSGTGQAAAFAGYLYPGGPTVESDVLDESGNVVRTARFTFGKEGEAISRTGSAETVALTYDAAYRTKTVQDGKSNATTYTYDANSHVSEVDRPGATGTSFDRTRFTSYDPVGNVLSRTDGNGQVANYTYGDSDGLLSAVNHPGANSVDVTLSFDPYDRMTSQVDGTGSATVAYDDLGNVTSTTRTYAGLPAQTISYAYWPDGSRKTMTNPGGTWTYGYDADGRYASLVSPAGVSNAGYYDNGWQASRQLPSGVTTTYGYNAAGALTGMANAWGTTARSSYGNFAYDGAFNLTRLTASVPGAASQSGSTTYAYDTKDRLLGESSSRLGGYSQSHAYDAAGNPTTLRGASATFNADNQPTANAYDGNGSPTTYRGTSVAYDAERRPTSFGSSLAASYRADGLRGWKSVAGVKTYYLYDQGKPVVEMDASGNVTAVNVFAPDGLVARRQGNAWTQYAFDPQGSVAQRLDGAGNVQSSSVYDAYGAESSAGSSTDPFGFNARSGYYTDRETGMILCGARYYDPASGRWLTRDPLDVTGGINLYGYCASRPVGRSDPSGLINADDMDAVLSCLGSEGRLDLKDTYLATYASGQFHRALPPKVSGPNGETNADIECNEIIQILEGLHQGVRDTDINHRRSGGKRKDDKKTRSGLDPGTGFDPCPEEEDSGINPWLLGAGAVGLGLLALGLAVASGGAAVPAEAAAAEALLGGAAMEGGGGWIVTGTFVA